MNLRRILKRSLGGAATLAVAASLAGTAIAEERIVVVTHGSNTDLFWNIVKNATSDAARDMKIRVEYRNPPTGDLTEMARLIDAAVASRPSGLIVSIPDVNALGPSIKRATAAGIPVVSINSGSDVRESLGALFHVGQPEFEAGLGGGKRAKAAGVRKAICVNHEIFNVALEQRCKGYEKGLGSKVAMLDTGSDPSQIRNRVSAYLSRNKDIDGILVVGASPVDAVLKALDDVGKQGKLNLGAFDLSQVIVKGLEDGSINYAIDQQQYLQGYLPVVALALQARYGLLPGGDILSGPGFVTKQNVALVKRYAGKIR